MLEFILLTAFPGAMAFAAAMDLFTMTIPNRISLFLVAAFFLLAPFSGMSLEQFGWHIATFVVVLAAGIFAFARGWMGGGDAKLIAAASLWLGFEHLFAYGFVAALVGGLLGGALLIYREMIPPLWMQRQDWAMRLHNRREGIPYGIALCAGGLMVYPSTHWVMHLAG